MKELIYATDEDLLAGIQGDRLNEAILLVYRQFEHTITSTIKNAGGSEQDGEDIFQETVVAFIDLVKNKKFLGTASIKTILVSIARNIWLNEIKKRKSLGRRGREFEINRGQIQEDITSDLYHREIKQQFLSLIDKLGEPCKTILTNFYYQNLSFKEILANLSYENEQVVRNKKSKCVKDLISFVKSNDVILKYINN